MFDFTPQTLRDQVIKNNEEPIEALIALVNQEMAKARKGTIHVPCDGYSSVAANAVVKRLTEAGFTAYYGGVIGFGCAISIYLNM